MNSRIVQPAPSFQPPDTCTEHSECQSAQTPLEDLRRNALEHYERVTTVAHEWYSVVPKAINAYFDGPALSSRDAEIREVLEGLMTRRWFGDKPAACWCDPRAYPDSDDDEDQDARCRRTRALWAKLQPGKEDE